MPAADDTLLPPRYRDAHSIAHGGIGEIYRATDQELGREVAVKVLARHYAEDESSRARFQREALTAARVSNSPHIVTIFDVAEHEGRPLIVMEYLGGGSLECRVDGRKPCPPRQVLEWLDDAAAALDAAHAAGVVHRDVKPGNLLLDEQGHVKVADFGIASAAGLDSLTQTGTILGTTGYLSPEQARGERATAASDCYALAVVAWELLTGRRPFEATSPTAEAAAPCTHRSPRRRRRTRRCRPRAMRSSCARSRRTPHGATRGRRSSSPTCGTHSTMPKARRRGFRGRRPPADAASGGSRCCSSRAASPPRCSSRTAAQSCARSRNRARRSGRPSHSDPRRHRRLHRHPRPARS